MKISEVKEKYLINDSPLIFELNVESFCFFKKCWRQLRFFRNCNIFPDDKNEKNIKLIFDDMRDDGKYDYEISSFTKIMPIKSGITFNKQKIFIRGMGNDLYGPVPIRFYHPDIPTNQSKFDVLENENCMKAILFKQPVSNYEVKIFKTKINNIGLMSMYAKDLNKTYDTIVLVFDYRSRFYMSKYFMNRAKKMRLLLRKK